MLKRIRQAMQAYRASFVLAVKRLPYFAIGVLLLFATLNRIRQEIQAFRASFVLAFKRLPYFVIWAILLFVLPMFFVFAAAKLDAQSLICVVVLTFLMSVLVFVVQIGWAKLTSNADDGNGFWRKLKLRHHWGIVLVGVATHYSAFTIGVSSLGAVVFDPPSPATLWFVMLQQVFLSGAAVILVNAFGRARLEKP